MKILALLALLMLVACAPPKAGPPDAWMRYDLRRNAPEATGGEVRDEPRMMGDPRLLGNKVAVPQVSALVAPSGTALRWRLKLGAEPYLSYIPLGRSRPGCMLRYRVVIEPENRVPLGGSKGGKDSMPERLLRRRLAPFDIYAPATVELPLSTYAGQDVTLVLAARTSGAACGDRPPDAVWGNPAVWSRGPVPAAVGSEERPNVVLIGLDTLRADALGIYGRRPSPSPALDALAAESDVYLNAFSTFNVTNPSFASIMTGLYGKNHGVYNLQTPLPADYPTLAELFGDAGYDTAAFLSVEHLEDRRSGLGQGFDTVDVTDVQYAAEHVVDQAMAWLSERRRPFFLWLHAFDPHNPLKPPQPFSHGWLAPAGTGLGPVEAWESRYSPEEPGDYRELYLSEVAYLDRQIGRLIDFLESRGLLATTAIAVVADHGENLGEHGFLMSHIGLWDATTHVPLWIRWPGEERSGRRLPEMVQTIDLFPTLLAAAGLEVPEQDGQDLRSARPGRRLVFAETTKARGTMVRTADHLFFQSTASPRFQGGRYLFDLREDPAQEVNLAGRGLAVEDELASYIAAWQAQRREDVAAEGVELSPQEIEALEALGYAE